MIQVSETAASLHSVLWIEEQHSSPALLQRFWHRVMSSLGNYNEVCASKPQQLGRRPGLDARATVAGRVDCNLSTQLPSRSVECCSIEHGAIEFFRALWNI